MRKVVSSQRVAVLAMVATLFFTIVSLTQAKTVITVAGHEYTSTSLAGPMAEYTKLHPDIEFEFILIQTGNNDGINKIITMNVGDLMPDIIHGGLSVTPELLEAGILQPMPTKIANEVTKFFLPPLLPTVSYKGRLYGIPTENQNFALGRNQRMFDEAGVQGAINNWDELKMAAKKLTKVSGDGKVNTHGFSIHGHFSRFPQSFFNMLWANGGEYIDQNGQSHLNEQAAMETVQYLADLFASGQFSLTNTIRNAKSAISITPTFWRTQVQEQAPGELQYIRTSLFPSNKGLKVSYQYGWGLFVAERSDSSAAAWEFLRWLTMERAQSGFTRMSESLMALGSMPSNKYDLGRKEYLTDPFFQGFVAGLDCLRAEPVLPKMLERQTLIWQTLRPAIEGKASVAQAIADTHQKISNVLAEMNRK